MDDYSVLMSVYRKEKPQYLRSAIDSMLNQTIPPEQFVLVEDGEMTPELENVVIEYEESNTSLFTVIRNKENQGLGKALDCGMQFCRNELVARMDSDDISMLDRCEKELCLFQSDPNLSIVSGFINEFIDDPNHIVSVRTVPERQEDIKKRMRTRSAFNHPAVMYKKSEVLRCGGYGELKRKQDHDLFSRMMNNGCYAYNLQEPILCFRGDAENLKRRKSWNNCKSYIIAQWHIFKRKECSVIDFIYVFAAQFFFFIAPSGMVNLVSKKLLRTDVK